MESRGRFIEKVAAKSEARESGGLQGRNLARPNLIMDGLHVADFPDAIRNYRRPDCDGGTVYKSVPAMQLGIISWRVGRDLNIDPKNGHIIKEPNAQKLWSRT